MFETQFAVLAVRTSTRRDRPCRTDVIVKLYTLPCGITHESTDVGICAWGCPIKCFCGQFNKQVFQMDIISYNYALLDA